MAQHQFSVFKIVSNCYYVRSAASLSPKDRYLFDKQSWWLIQYLIAANKICSFLWAHHCWSINLRFNKQPANANGIFQAPPLFQSAEYVKYAKIFGDYVWLIFIPTEDLGDPFLVILCLLKILATISWWFYAYWRSWWLVFVWKPYTAVFAYSYWFSSRILLQSLVCQTAYSW